MTVMLPVFFDLFGTFGSDAVGFQPVPDHSVVLQEILKKFYKIFQCSCFLTHPGSQGKKSTGSWILDPQHC
jgi:hypothetical protein